MKKPHSGAAVKKVSSLFTEASLLIFDKTKLPS